MRRFRSSPSTTARTLACGLLLAGLAGLAGCGQMNGFVMNRFGQAYYRAGDYTTARGEFQRAVADDPYNADYVYNLASSMQKQGQLAKAESTYRHALKLNPGHQPSFHGMSSLLMDQGRHVEADELLATWITAEPYRAEPYIELSWYRREIGDTAGAEQALLDAMKVNPQHPVVAAHLGQLYQDSGRLDRAAAMYQRSLMSDWSQPEVRSRLSSLRQQPAGGGTVIASPIPVITTISTPTPLTTPQPAPQPAPQPQPSPVPIPSVPPPPPTADAGVDILPVVSPY